MRFSSSVSRIWMGVSRRTLAFLGTFAGMPSTIHDACCLYIRLRSRTRHLHCTYKCMDTPADMRRERGLVLAKDKRIKRIAGATWAVPSQGGATAYLVHELAATCSCPSYETRRVKC